MINCSKSGLSQKNYTLCADKNTGVKAFNTSKLTSQPYADTFTRSTKARPSFGGFEVGQIVQRVREEHMEGVKTVVQNALLMIESASTLSSITSRTHASDAVVLIIIPDNLRSTSYYQDLIQACLGGLPADAKKAQSTANGMMRSGENPTPVTS